MPFILTLNDDMWLQFILYVQQQPKCIQLHTLMLSTAEANTGFNTLSKINIPMLKVCLLPSSLFFFLFFHCFSARITVQ